MSFVGKIARSLLIGPVLGALGIGKKGRPPVLQKPVTRDEAREEAERDDELARRRGAAADMLTGTRGAEASAGSIGRLVVGN